MKLPALNRKENEKALIEKGFLDLLESMYLIAISLDIHGTILYTNPHLLRITGYTLEEIKGKNWFDLFIPLKKIDTVKKTFEIIVGEKYKMRSENPILTKMGIELTIEWNNSPVLDKNGTVIGVTCIGVDITGLLELENLLKNTEESSRQRAELLAEQNSILTDTKKGMLNLLDDSKRLEEELQREKKSVEKKVVERTLELNQEKARLEAAINSVPSGFMVTDKTGGIILRNSAISKIFDQSFTDSYSLENLTKDLEAGADVSASFYSCVTDKKTILLKELSYNKKILNLYMAPIFESQSDKDTIGVIILITDVTEEKVLQRSKDEFFSIASHELRTPITAIRGNVELITKYYANKINEPNFLEMLADIKQSSTRLIHLVNEFLNTSRLEQGRMVFNISKFDMTEVVHEAVVELQTTAKYKNLTLSSSILEEFKPLVVADRDKTKEVLLNLVGNAIAYTEVGGVEIYISRDMDSVKTSVVDTGKGILPENQKLLFRKFQQANTSIYARDLANSTGLGLYISKLLIESMGGKIYLEKSDVNIGSTFVFTLPLSSV